MAPTYQPRGIRYEPCQCEVTHHDINRAMRFCRQQCDDCRHVVQFTKLFVTKLPEHARKNCKIEMDAPHFTAIFWSDTGYQQNHFVFQLIDNELHITTMKESWRMWFERLASECWSFLKYTVRVVVGVLTGSDLQSISW